MTRLYLDTAIRLPAPDVEALIQGRAIAAIPQQFLDPGRIFALYPADAANSPPINSETVQIKAWARCELCQILDKSEPLESLSRLTIWTTEALENILSQRPYIFLAYFRVYLLPEPLEIPANERGQFVGLPQAMSVSDSTAVLSERTFSQRRHQLENRLPPPHPELEELQAAVAQLNTPESKQLDEQIQIFLGWKEAENATEDNSDLAWIKTITSLGDRSQELDEKKSNYQAGTDFENIVRKSLEYLGFTVDEAYKGGAGGLDLFCSKPYPLVGECKAGKAIPSRTAEELIKLGGMRLDESQFQNAAKLIIGPGKPSKDVLTAAQKFKISIINPMSLQKLTELQAQYPGSVNLFELKKYLEPGQIDNKIDEYVEKVVKEVKLRSHLVSLVKKYLENTGLENVGVDALHGIYFGSNPTQPLKTEEMYEILLELSSPLTGYLGRNKGSDWRSDRFYFLRDLTVDLNINPSTK
ncbi:DUF1802 family protein [Microseira wollei]|uniref:DUF1802 domain-containing protein n=1 Tax=Microseira wollei NIES-4236 TaxID=2530354 RepID=A0AAV3XCS6_9CYAN|nr:DUF1802 family protein [Microseira wollei]GET40144.1 hypothetical protein MiSe_49520 [Microseira wollei NIES-4236]